MTGAGSWRYFFTDIAGYTALMQADEVAALHTLKHFKDALEEKVPGNQGHIVQ